MRVSFRNGKIIWCARQHYKLKIDQNNGNELAVRRFLDGAARRAQQEGSVVIVTKAKRTRWDQHFGRDGFCHFVSPNFNGYMPANAVT